MKIFVKRIYEKPSKKDGTRVLVDHLWPRGIAKSEAAIDFWLQDLAPSSELRKWFHEDKEGRLSEFITKYQKELAQKKILASDLLKKSGNTLTLVTAVKDVENSHIPTLLSFLKKISHRDRNSKNNRT